MTTTAGQSMAKSIKLTRFDVITGKGRSNEGVGNKNYRALVKNNKVLYAKTAEGDKMKIVNGIIATIHDFGGRFLEFDKQTGSYQVLDSEAASTVVGSALRSGQPQIRLKILASDDSELPCISKGQFPYESYAEYSSYMYASLLVGKARLDYSPHVAELMNLSRFRPKGITEEVKECSQLGLDILNEPLARNSGDWLFLDEFFGPADAADPSIFDDCSLGDKSSP
ncbi:hypothetical protein THAOC_02215 [Thalassiosira oceanica]|uniref:DUF6824 domain-containing protein n=1 Tax=Thalassiosira oceanica TaxID=159749 RepID=K0TMB0_THAOC|nr:hypothetical protein THAOC_02215 [Thalassiosira oceanica]|eukprot:EJK76046.1 hypothetical protein THAOC_02215 [Thalassiosira oceanica]